MSALVICAKCEPAVGSIIDERNQWQRAAARLNVECIEYRKALVEIRELATEPAPSDQDARVLLERITQLAGAALEGGRP